jgi:hypothetical protein
MKKRTSSYLLLGGGALTLGAAWLMIRRAGSTRTDVEKAIAGTDEPQGDQGAQSTQGRGLVDLKLTTYWPFAATPEERKMEGGLKDRKGNPLHTVEDFLAGKSDYVSLAGDYTIWPYGQKVLIPWGDKTLTGRVVDTGGHFFGAGKLYRVVGHEPIDVCVFDKSNKPPKSTVTAQIVAGDSFESGASVATGKLKGQTILGADVVEGFTQGDVEALARAIESELGGRPIEERAAAAWAMRNRAAQTGCSVERMLSPRGSYGSASETGGYASTRKTPTSESRRVAWMVLDADQDADPTGGASEFWAPRLQEQLHELGGIHRAATKLGDERRAKKYARYAGYASEDEVRERHALEGLGVSLVVGSIELLRRA